MSGNTLLSFCISTYNRSAGVAELVRSILRYPGEEIEVVVLDNGSTDDTAKALAGIGDARLKYRTNGVNKGAVYNMVNVMEKGAGDFLVFSTDKDSVDHREIGPFIEFLQAHDGDLVAGYCWYACEGSGRRRFFARGAEGIRNVAYTERHPSGFFFKRECLAKVGLSRRFSNYEKVDLFPMEFAFAEVCLMGRSAVYEKPLFIPAYEQLLVDPESVKPPLGAGSHTTSGRSNDAFFTPRKRLKMAVSYSAHLSGLDIPFREKVAIIGMLLRRALGKSTRMYRFLVSNEVLCRHYGIRRRHIDAFGLMKITVFFYLGLIWQVLAEGRIKRYFFFFLPFYMLEGAIWIGLTALTAPLFKRRRNASDLRD